MNLEDAVAAPPPPPAPTRALTAVPNADTPGAFSYDGRTGYLNTRPLAERPTSWDEYLRDAGLDPDAVDVLEPVEVRGWDANVGDGKLERLRYYKLRVVARRAGPTVDELVAAVARRRFRPRPVTGNDAETFLVAPGDLQLGKIDGDGVDGTLARAQDCLAGAAEQLKALRRARPQIGPVLLTWLADCIEGFQSQGGTNAWRTSLTLTEQLRVSRRLMLWAVDLFAPLTDRLILVGIAGNHDEATRFGKAVTRYDDSHDVETVVAVSDALKLNPGAYGHVHTYTPGRDELTVTLETSNTIVGMAHGHKWSPGKAFEWWAGQALGDTAIGRADVLLSGHYHHLRHERQGHRTWVQVPALESESAWWRHSKGTQGSPGVVTAVLRDHRVGHLHVIEGDSYVATAAA